MKAKTMDTKSLIIGVVIGFVVGLFLIRYFPSIFSRTTTETPILCKPNYVFAGLWVGEDICKSSCYKDFKVTSYIANISNTYNAKSCFCDINNCDPK